MSTPAWILDILAAMMVLVAEVSAGQLLIARAWTRRGGAGAGILVFRLLTGIAMAGILVPGLSILPNAAWETAFAVITAWFAWCLWRENRGRGAAAVAHGPYAPHLVQSAATLYMFAALAGPSAAGSSGAGGMSGMEWGPAVGMPVLRAPTLALIFALLLIALTVHDLNRQAGPDGYFQVALPGPALAAAGAGPAAYTAKRLLFSPAVVKGCQVAISVTVAFILIITI
jgi:Domain of unknown function (DUF5134)